MPILEVKADQSAIRRSLRAVSDLFFGKQRISPDKLPAGEQRPDVRSNAKAAPRRAEMTRLRLTEAVARLEHLGAERERRGDSRFGRIAEHRIVWGELIELELQEIDEQVSRICGVAGRSTPAPAKSTPREGGPHGRDNP